MPADHLLPDRLAAVLAVIYLIFNEGYTDRGDLAAEAIRLGRLLAELMPDEPEVHGLLALMLLHDSRREARFVDGELVPLAEQDRSLWNRAKIDDGRARSTKRWPCVGAGRTCCRRRSRRCRPTTDRLERDHRALRRARTSDRLASRRPQPRGGCRRGEGPERALEIIDSLELDEYRYLHSTRAELLRRLGRGDEAREAFERALELATAEPERRFLERRIEEL